VLALGYAYLTAAPLPRLIQPYLERISEKTGESCSCSILDGAEIVYVARSSQRRVLSIALNVGSRLPAYCASMGRVLLAALPEEEARRIIVESDRKPLTLTTVTDVEALMTVLEEVRANDFAMVDQELELGLRSIAVPLRDARGRVAAAANVGLHAARMTCEQMKAEILPELRSMQSSVRSQLS
jgi:IclR family pca regulon transcriptional regulator